MTELSLLPQPRSCVKIGDQAARTGAALWRKGRSRKRDSSGGHLVDGPLSVAGLELDRPDTVHRHHP